MNISENLGEEIIISKEIIVEEITGIAKYYNKLEELFLTKPVPECLQINITGENLTQIQYDKEYSNLVSKDIVLGKYCDKTIYIFSVETFPYDKNEIKKRFKELSSKTLNEKKISLCRINETSPEWENIDKNKPVCLYVGSSKNIRKRLKEHLFLYNAKKTYAMHLEAWFPKDLPITISIWGFNDFFNDEEIDYLQNIEDILWNHYKPLLGKQGKK